MSTHQYAKNRMTSEIRCGSMGEAAIASVVSGRNACACPRSPTVSPLNPVSALAPRSTPRAYLPLEGRAYRIQERTILRAMIEPRTAPATGFHIKTTVRDALYDRIPLGQPDLALIGTAPFARLERIQQLGFVSRVWPGARHTRYEHSLGVLHLARLAVDHLRTTTEGAWITDLDARTIAAAALLHDVGHYPFSHAIEELGPPIMPHEAVGRVLIERDPVASILVREWEVDPARVATIVDPRGQSLPESDRVLRSVLSGPLDVDKLDYLPRDARACHVPYGGVDTARLIDSLRIAEIDGERRIVVGDKGVSPLHSLINARQEMFDNVYWHHTNRACMVMLLRAVQEALLVGAVTPEELIGHDDDSLLTRLASDAMPAATRRLARALRDRH